MRSREKEGPKEIFTKHLRLFILIEMNVVVFDDDDDDGGGSKGKN